MLTKTTTCVHVHHLDECPAQFIERNLGLFISGGCPYIYLLLYLPIYLSVHICVRACVYLTTFIMIEIEHTIKIYIFSYIGCIVQRFNLKERINNNCHIFFNSIFSSYLQANVPKSIIERVTGLHGRS